MESRPIMGQKSWFSQKHETFSLTVKLEKSFTGIDMCQSAQCDRRMIVAQYLMAEGVFESLWAFSF